MSDPVTRRSFVASLGLAVAAAASGGAEEEKRSKRDALLSLRKGGPGPGYVPAAFFMHFGEQARFGPAAVEKHLDYFRSTGMDFVKVQYEQAFPPRPQIRTPADWKGMPRYGLDFYRPQLEVVEGLVKAAGGEALVLVTLYSPFMCAGHTVGRTQVARHIEEDGEAVQKGLETITESLLGFVRECRNLGADGFYASTQGGERDTFRDAGLFGKHVTPSDLALFREIDRTSALQHPPHLRFRGSLRRPHALPRVPGPRGQLQPAPDHRRVEPAGARPALRPPDHGRDGPQGGDRHRERRGDPARHGGRPAGGPGPLHPGGRVHRPRHRPLGGHPHRHLHRARPPGGLRTAIATAHAFRG